ncbi:hypothetical protein BGZ76_006091, partial [Entomortierella beljakovae]
MCSTEFKTEQDLKIHNRDSHPSKVRISVLDDSGQIVKRDLKPVDGVFTCPVCGHAGIKSRTGIVLHLKKHLSDGSNKRNAVKNFCADCRMKFETPQDLEKHYDETHPIFQENAENSEDDDTLILQQAKSELNRDTKNASLSDLILEVLEPFTATHEDGSESITLLYPTNAKRAISNPIIKLRPTKKPRIAINTEPGELQAILALSQSGDIIDINDYEVLEPSFYLQEFRKFKAHIAQNLAGVLIQTGAWVFLILKAEIYGRDPNDDPHAVRFAMPASDVKTVMTITHDNVDKLIIGTFHWNALVTSSIELASGTINVGAHNSTAKLTSQAIIW